jgi:hypothetical protein
VGVVALYSNDGLPAVSDAASPQTMALMLIPYVTIMRDFEQDWVMLPLEAAIRLQTVSADGVCTEVSGYYWIGVIKPRILVTQFCYQAFVGDIFAGLQISG